MAKFDAAIIATFLWIGFVGAISFMEAWLKFRAPGVTIPIGLGIGRLVFGALNKMEWLFFGIVLINMFFKDPVLSIAKNPVFLLPFVILCLQTFWLLPKLDARAQLRIQDLPVPTSNLHIVFVVMEVFKILALFISGIRFLRL